MGYRTAAVAVAAVALLAGVAHPSGPGQITDGAGPVDVTVTVSPGELAAGGTVTLTIRVRTAFGSSSLPVVVRFLRPDGWRPHQQGIDAGRGSYVCRGSACADEHRLELRPNSDGVAVATVQYRVPPGSVAGSHDVGLSVSAFPYDDVEFTEQVTVEASAGTPLPAPPPLGFVAKIATILGTLIAAAEFARRRGGRRGDGT